MTERSDQLTDAAIAQFLRSRSADPDLGLLDDIVRTVGATAQDRPWLGLPSNRLPRRTLLILASALLLATMGAIGFGSRFLQPDPLVIAFGGTWISTSDADGGTQTMDVSVSADGTVDIVVTDDVATVCSRSPSTMTGTGRIDEGTALVIPAPTYTCDDGSKPETLSGPPLEEQLRNWTLALDAGTGTLTDRVGGVWHREGAAVPSPDSSSPPAVSVQMWPQATLEEVREAQQRADAADPDYSWQVDPQLDGDAAPWGAEIFTRFIEEELGWEEFVGGWDGSGYLSMGEGGGVYEAVVFIRCAPGETNPLSPLYTDAPHEVRACAPTIDDFRYETVSVDVSQPGRRGPEGIWVVDGWELRRTRSSDPNALWGHLYPEFDGQVAQTVPPSDADVTALLQAFLQARTDGVGAEQYVLREPERSPFGDLDVPLLYATTSGAPYQRSEVERVQGPVWPNGWTEYKLRLFAGETVVEQYVHVIVEDGRLGVMYGDASNAVPTTENGQPVPAPYRFLDGEVAFEAAPPWSGWTKDGTSASLGRGGGGPASQFTTFTVVANPRTGTGCATGSAPSDAAALARSIRSNPDLEATDPVTVTVGGSNALRMDVVAPGQEVGGCTPVVLEDLSLLQGESRMRVYLIDLPEGMSARVLAIAITAHESMFDDVLEAAAPVLDSLEIHTP